MPVTLIDLSPVGFDRGDRWDAIFGDPRRPEWMLTLTMAEDSPGRFLCVGAHFDTQAHGADLPVKWIARFPVAQCVREARLALQEWLVDGGDVGLPLGFPTRSNRDRWYPKLLECLDTWQESGMSPMESYREVARRKRVDVNRVKQWVFVGRRLAAETGRSKGRRKR